MYHRLNYFHRSGNLAYYLTDAEFKISIDSFCNDHHVSIVPAWVSWNRIIEQLIGFPARLTQIKKCFHCVYAEAAYVVEAASFWKLLRSRWSTAETCPQPLWSLCPIDPSQAYSCGYKFHILPRKLSTFPVSTTCVLMYKQLLKSNLVSSTDIEFIQQKWQGGSDKIAP